MSRLTRKESSLRGPSGKAGTWEIPEQAVRLSGLSGVL